MVGAWAPFGLTLRVPPGRGGRGRRLSPGTSRHLPGPALGWEAIEGVSVTGQAPCHDSPTHRPRAELQIRRRAGPLARVPCRLLPDPLLDGAGRGGARQGGCLLPAACRLTHLGLLRRGAAADTTPPQWVLGACVAEVGLVVLYMQGGQRQADLVRHVSCSLGSAHVRLGASAAPGPTGGKRARPPDAPPPPLPPSLLPWRRPAQPSWASLVRAC